MLIFLLLAVSFRPQTEQEMLAIEASAVAMDYWYKSPVDVELSQPAESTVALSSRPTLRIVNADETTAQGIVPLQVHLVDFRSPLPVGPSRAMASVSPGASVGRGIWSWRCTVCNVTDQSQAIDQGDVEYAANTVGIPSIGFGEASVSLS